jgi:hypothetical protein
LSYETSKDNYPIALTRSGEVVKGMLAHEEVEKLAHSIGYEIIPRRSDVYRFYERSDMFIDDSGKGWISVDLHKPGTSMSREINYESAIYGFEKRDGDWQVVDFINLFNFPALRYNIFVDRILKVEGDRLWLWVREGFNITEPYEERSFDRQIWVIERN